MDAKIRVESARKRDAEAAREADRAEGRSLLAADRVFICVASRGEQWEAPPR